MDDDRCYRFSGGKISLKDDKSTLMVWPSAKFSFHEIDSEDFAEDALVLSSLRSTKSQPDATKSCLLIYCLQVLSKEDVNSENKMKCTREVVAVDKDQSQCVITLINSACDKAKEKNFILVKGANTYRGEVNVWGSAMVNVAPQDLSFPLSGTYKEL